MKHILRILLFLSLAAILTTAQNMKQSNTQANAKFAQMTDQFVKDSLVLSPVSASEAGYHKHKDPKTGKTIDLDAQLDDVSSQAMATQEKFYREWRKRFQTETPVASLNPQDAADYRLIDDQIALNLLDFEHIQSYKHNPTGYVELIADFSDWMKNDLAKRPTNGRTWRLGKEWYDQKFRYVMETSITPEQLLADAEAKLKAVRAEMLQLALPLYRQMYPGQDDYSNLPAHERENKIIRAVLDKISDEHPQRDQLIDAVKADLEGIKQFIREKKIVTLGS